MQHFHVYTLPTIIPSDITLVLNTTDHIVTLMVDTTIETQQRFTAPEMTILLTLLEAHPAPCTNAMLYAALTGVEPNNAHEFLQAVGDYVDIAMTPVRMVLKQCRTRLAPFNLGIQPVNETAYTLFRLD